MNKMKDFLESEEYEIAMEKWLTAKKKEMDLEEVWTDRMWDRIKNNLDTSIQKIIDWYSSDRYRDREYGLGYEPRESLFWILIKVAEKYGQECDDHEIEKYGNTFTVEIFKLGSYVIQLIQGQGAMILVEKI